MLHGAGRIIRHLSGNSVGRVDEAHGASITRVMLRSYQQGGSSDDTSEPMGLRTFCGDRPRHWRQPVFRLMRSRPHFSCLGLG